MNFKIEARNLRSEKIQDIHLERLAVVYVRQSTLKQVLEHQESTRLQYGLVARAECLCAFWHNFARFSGINLPHGNASSLSRLNRDSREMRSSEGEQLLRYLQ